MKSLTLYVGAAILGGAATANATLLYGFESGLQGWSGSGATVSQSTTGATEGTHSMEVQWSGGFHWLTTGDTIAGGQATDLMGQSSLLFDVTVQSGGISSPWANMLLSYNDNSGWRQLPDAKQVTIPTAAGTYHLAFDVSGLASPDLSGKWFQLNISVNGAAGTSNTVFIDNMHVNSVPEPAPVCMMAAGFGAFALLRRRRR